MFPGFFCGLPFHLVRPVERFQTLAVIGLQGNRSAVLFLERNDFTKKGKNVNQLIMFCLSFIYMNIKVINNLNSL